MRGEGGGGGSSRENVSVALLCNTPSGVVPQLKPSQERGEGCVNTQTGSVSVAGSQSNIVSKDNGEGGSSVNTQTGSVSVAGSQSNIVISECTCPTTSEGSMLSESMRICKNDCEKNVRNVISELSERVSIPPAKKIVNIKSDGANRSCFADILKSSNGYKNKKKINIKINNTERGKFEIAKGSPVSMKIIRKSSTETSGLTVSNRLRLSTNGKAAKEDIIQTNSVSNRNTSVGQVKPSKRKLMEVGGGEVRSLVCIFENGITKPTWREKDISESPAKRQRCSNRGAK